MRLMRTVDPEGVALRRKRQLHRRMYYSEVGTMTVSDTTNNNAVNSRDQTTYGM